MTGIIRESFEAKLRTDVDFADRREVSGNSSKTIKAPQGAVPPQNDAVAGHRHRGESLGWRGRQSPRVDQGERIPDRLPARDDIAWLPDVITPDQKSAAVLSTLKQVAGEGRPVMRGVREKQGRRGRGLR